LRPRWIERLVPCAPVFRLIAHNDDPSVSRACVVVVLETETGGLGVSFDRLKHLADEVSQEGRAFGADVSVGVSGEGASSV
jgi:hypothetical protein